MSRLLAFAQLIRLPNVFTALADICLGLLTTVVLGQIPPTVRWWLAGGCFLAASACLYSAGMVWNDWLTWNKTGANVLSDLSPPKKSRQKWQHAWAAL